MKISKREAVVRTRKQAINRLAGKYKATKGVHPNSYRVLDGNECWSCLANKTHNCNHYDRQASCPNHQACRDLNTRLFCTMGSEEDLQAYIKWADKWLRKNK